MDRRFHLGGFESERGEVVRKGDPNVFGINPQPGNIPIGPAPPHIRQVIATFDSRPIGAYDFVLSDAFNPYTEAPFGEVTTAPGFISIVRRVEVEVSSGGVVLGEDQLWNFIANGVASTAWNYAAGKTLTTWGVDTFFVCQPNIPIRLRAALGFSGFTQSVSIITRFIGNLILDSNEPPTEQVGTLPHAVHIVQNPSGV